MDLDTQQLLRSSIHHLLTQPSTAALATRLDELGWDEVLADDSATALRILFEVKGDTVSGADALGPQLAAALASALGVDGLRSASVVLPTSGPSYLGASGELVVTGVVSSAPAHDARFVVPVVGDGGVTLAVMAGDGITTAAPSGTDAELGLVDVSGTVASADIVWLGGNAGSAWDQIVARGRWLLGAELVGVGRHVIQSAVEYTGQRVQYGRKIGTFQALQHRIASAHVLVAGAARVMEEASTSGLAWDAMVAKCLAGQAAEFACTQAQQCYGAIGFTWEHEFHRYLRRAYVLDQLLGSWRSLEFDIGNDLQRARTVPRVGSL
jgi:Acyl-CoA dehydrogenase, C-terminal domain